MRRLFYPLAIILVLVGSPAVADTVEQVSWLAFSSDRTGGGDIYLVDSAGDGLRRLTTDEAEDGAPAWSPDGKTLLFESKRDEDQMHIFAMNMDDGSIRRLTDKPFRHGTPRWSPDGSLIAYHSERQGPSQIFVMNFGTGEETQVSNIPGAAFLSATFSPDGFYLAAEGGSEGQKIETKWGTAGAYQIWEFDLNNSKIPKKLTSLQAYNGYPAWSPSGNLIAFDSTIEGWADILTVDPDDGTVVNLTKSPSQNEFADWSWDGKQIAFVSDRDGNNEIYVMSADGSGARRITSHPGEDSAPSWSPPR